ncbi:B3 domain-containing protein Os01g0234100-like isoform X1 [Punica granatum]|uniref:B3 domain-containing protein Os01g0234100-like isoform X1 n=2 Tax=Punica granatum TaxID=22663 RepID=A0A6P8CAU9_PUNGR|nr:B3 domain-containing protein Os01g0234100-like isoform X1 [Punica granatum]
MDSLPDPNLNMALVVTENAEPPQAEQDFSSILEPVSSPTPRESKRQKRLMVDDLYHYDHVGVKSSTMERAEEFTRSLTPPGLPTFLKTMVRSNVATGFWLHLPMGFCKAHMPRHNSTVILEDENGEKYEVHYIMDKTALSAGWKLFTTARKLVEGDVVIFQLVEPCRFKVYIVRADEKSVADGMPELDASAGQIAPANDAKRKVVQHRVRRRKSKPSRNRSLVVAETQITSAQDNESKEVSEDPSLVTNEGTRILANCSPDFEEAKSTGNFTILVNSTAIDSELSETQRTKYYELCMTQNSYLHGNLLKSISPKLAAEIISETVNIAGLIRACDISTSEEEYSVWDKTLEGFEMLGMRVGFLRTRLGRLRELASEFQKYKNVETQREIAEQELRAIREELSQLKELRSRLDSEIEALKASVERHEHIFQQEASAAW